jgi:hypothetical protein
VWAYIAHSLKMLALGKRSNVLFDGTKRDAKHPYSEEVAGVDLPFRAIVSWVTGRRLAVVCFLHRRVHWHSAKHVSGPAYANDSFQNQQA